MVPSSNLRVPTAQGKLGKWKEKKQGILLAQVENTLTLKVKDIAIFAAKKSIFFQKLDRSANSVLCM